MARGDDRPLAAVCDQLGMPLGFADRSPAESAAESVDQAVSWLEHERPRKQNHWPALVLALIAQIESLLAAEHLTSASELLTKFPPEQGTSDQVVNTLNLTRGVGDSVKLRPLYNKALTVIRETMLRDHPSNAPHATQSWPAYRPLIEKLAEMSPAERRLFAEEVWKRGVLDRPARSVASVTERTIRPFEHMLRNMPTQVRGIRGGALLQAVAYGYLRSDSPNLILESHSVNTGSSRAGMLGDVDGFRGKEPELAAEVKDLHLSKATVETELSAFLEDIVEAPNATAVVICTAIDDDARALIEDRGVTILSKNDLIRTVAVWDLPKQEEAVRGVEYFLARIQKSGPAVEHLHNWLLSASLGYILSTRSSSAVDSAADDPE